MGERRGVHRVWCGNLRETGNLEDPDVDGRIILRSIFRKRKVEVWTGLSWFKVGTDDGHL